MTARIRLTIGKPWVKDSYSWSYLVPTSSVPADWNTLVFNDATWPVAVGGFGYGDGDDGTVIASPQTSVFMRHKFNIVDTSSIGDVYFHIVIIVRSVLYSKCYEWPGRQV